MSDRSRGRGARPEFGSRPLGRLPDFGGRSGMGRGPAPGNRPLGSVPVRTSSGGLAALGAALPGAAGAAAAAGAPAGGRGAGPDHREVRYADGVLAMINVLRLLSLGGPRTWDSAAHKQLGMQQAVRPSAGAAGREVHLAANHFALALRPGASVGVYSLGVEPLQQGGGSAAGEPPAAGGEPPARRPRALPQPLLRAVVEQLAGEAGWPTGWFVVGGDRLAAPGPSLLGANGSHEAVVALRAPPPTLSATAGGQEAADGGAGQGAGQGAGEAFRVAVRYLGHQGVDQPRGAAAAEAAGGSAALLGGVLLLEALLLAAALRPATGGGASAGAGAGGHPAGASAPVPVPVPDGSGAGAALVGSGSTGLMGLAGSAGAAGGHLLGAAAGPSSLSPTPGSPAAAGLLAASTLQPPSGAAAAATAGALAPAPSGGLGGAASGLAALLGGVRRVQVGGSIYFHSPGSPELHAQLGGGVEAWLGAKQHVAVTQGGPALVLDLTAAPFYAPGPLLAALPALLGRPAAQPPQPQQQQQPDGLEQPAAPAAAAAASAAALSAPLSAEEHAQLERLLRGLKVELSLPGRPPRRLVVSRLSPRGAADTRFALSAPGPAGEAGAEVTVAEYFRAAHGVELAAPHLPCLGVARRGGEGEGEGGADGGDDGGEGAGPVCWYPPELAAVPPGQRFLAPLEPPQLAALARLGAKKASDRKACLEALAAPLATPPAPGAPPPLQLVAPLEPGAAPAAAGQQPGAALLGASGVELSGLLTMVRGRVLPAPHLAYGTPECCYPGSQGQWNVKNCRLPSCSRITSWCLVALMPQAQVDIEGSSGVAPFVHDLAASLRGAGVECEVPPVVYEQPGMSVLQHLRAGCEAAQKHFNAGAQLLLVMLPHRSSSLYREVKVASDAVLGLPSQVLVAPVAGVGRGVSPRGRLQYCANLGLKINAKMGGVNMRLAGNPDQVIPVVGGRPFILFGAALAPPAPGAPPGTPATAAVVASRDRSLGRYSSRVLLQPWERADAGAGAGSRWAVAGLRGAARELLIDFYRQNGGRKPEALLCYRAVGGDGQGPAVLDEEYRALRSACFDLEEGYCPPITFVAVNRSHGTRLFPADRDNQDKAGNCLPGTVVDAGICHPAQFDFFLNSHAGLQGHNKPAHYHVLVDESAFSADGLQLLTYWLCYLYCRCTRSVSVVPPAYYAQLAAERGRLLAAGRDLLPPAGDAAAAAAPEAAAEAAGEAAADGGTPAGGPRLDVRVNARLGGSMYYV